MQSCVVCTVIQYFVIGFYSSGYRLSLHFLKTVREDLLLVQKCARGWPSSLIIQKSAIYEVEHQPRFYALNFVADSINIESILMIRDIATVDRGSFLR